VLSVFQGRGGGHGVDAALPEWLSEYAVQAYTTPDSAVSYLINHAQIVLCRTTAAESCENNSSASGAECALN